MPARICVIFNPSAKGGKAERLRRQMLEFKDECAFKLTSHAGAGKTLAAEAVREGFETIVAAGGDGTVNEVLNGIASAPDGLERARLAILPIGTMNVFARELRIPLNVLAAWEAIREGGHRTIDLPWVEYQSKGTTTRRCFAQLAGIGFDARAIELVSLGLKQRFGPLAYVVAGLKALARQPSSICVARGAEKLKGDFAIIGNGRFYAGPIPICPDANISDGLLDVCLFPRTTLTSLGRHVCSCLSPTLRRWSPTVQFQSSVVEVAGEANAPLEVDGEFAGHLPARFSIAPGALRVIAPPRG